MSIRDTIEREIQHLVQRRTDLITEDTALASERRKLEDQLRTIARKQEHARTERGEIDQEIEAANRALAVLVEHQPTPTPVPEPEPVPTPASPPSPATPAKPKAKRTRKDASHVHHRTASHPVGMGAGSTRTRLTDAEPVDLDTVSPIVLERAEWVYEILCEAENKRLSQHLIAVELQGLLDGDPPFSTIQGIVTDTLQALIAQHRVVFTGEKVAIREGGRRQSAVWRVATPPEQACAGLPVGDDTDYEGTTTRPATQKTQFSGYGKVAVDSSGFETKR